MLLQQENWIKGYNQIVADCRPQNSYSGSAGTVLILCNPDADALCAARILSYILRADNVPYQLRPCGGIRKLMSILESLNLYSHSSASSSEDLDNDSIRDFNNNFDDTNLNLTNSAIRAIVLLNIGVTKNLNTLLYSPRPITRPSSDLEQNNEEEQNENDVDEFNPPLVSNLIKTFVLDNHRPYHLANIHAGKNIVVWNDYDHWHLEEGGIPSDGDNLSGDEEDSDDEEESDEDESDEDESVEDVESDGEEAEFEDEDDIQEEKQTATESLKRQQEDDSVVDDDDNDTSPIRTKRQRQEDPDTPDTEKMSDEEDQAEDTAIVDGNDFETGASSLHKVDVVQSIREQLEIRRDKIRKYYDNGSFHSSPVSYMMYMLSIQQRHASVGDLLWLACVGVTDAFVHNRLDLSGYMKLSMDLQNRVKDTYADSDDDRMNLINQRLNNTFYAEDLYSGVEDNRPMTQVGLSENGRILIQKDEFRFFLLRHTSLWEAMLLSSEVNTKMELWTQRGIKRLREMLAMMGLPLNQCQQPYAFMKPSLRRRLKSMVEDHAEEYGLDKTILRYTGFVRVTGYKSLLSASDVAYAITALLECESSSNEDNLMKGGQSTSEDQNTFDAENVEERGLISSFNTAYDALNPNGSSSVNSYGICSGGYGSSIMGSTEGLDLSSIVNGGDSGGNTSGIGAGIRLAFQLQSAIVATAISLVERKAITRLSHFRYVYVHATSQGVNGGNNFKSSSDRTTQKQNHHIFSKPLALTKLAHFLMDMHRTNKKWTGTKAKPLIVLAEKPQTQTYLVAGYEFPDQRGSIKRNKFKKNFKLATDTLKGTFKYDSFESNVVEVNAHEAQKFIEHLHFMIDKLYE